MLLSSTLEDFANHSSWILAQEANVKRDFFKTWVDFMNILCDYLTDSKFRLSRMRHKNSLLQFDSVVAIQLFLLESVLQMESK